jgi:hypothetical protein
MVSTATMNGVLQLQLKNTCRALTAEQLLAAGELGHDSHRCFFLCIPL